MVSRSGLLAIFLALAGAMAVPAAADDLPEAFRSPGSALTCTGLGAEFRCEGGAPGFGCVLPGTRDQLICFLTGEGVRLRPDWDARCEYSSGPAHVLRPTGRAIRGCAEPGVPDNAVTLAPGATWRRVGIRCENRAGTLHCANRSGRGFRIHPRRQELF